MERRLNKCPVCDERLVIQEFELATLFICPQGHFRRTRDFSHNSDNVDWLQKGDSDAA